MEYCYIFLPVSLDISQSLSLVIRKDESVIEPLKNRTIAELLDLQKKRNTILIINAENVSVYNIKLPNLSHHKAQTAIEFALEPQLSQPINSVHLTYNYDKTSQSYNIIVMDKRKLKTLIEQISAFKLFVNKIIVDVSLLHPFEAIRNHSRLLIKTDIYQGAIAASFMPLYESVIQYITHFNDEDRPDGEKIWLAKRLLISDPPNLCHNDFIIIQPRQNKINYYYLTLCPLILCLVSYFIFNLSMIYQETKKIEELDNKITIYYKQLFPNSSQQINPKFRTEQLIKKYQLESSSFWKIIKALSSYPITLDSINYNNNNLTISFTKHEFRNLEKYKQNLHVLGLKIKQLKAKQNGKTIAVSLEFSL